MQEELAAVIGPRGKIANQGIYCKEPAGKRELARGSDEEKVNTKANRGEPRRKGVTVG